MVVQASEFECHFGAVVPMSLAFCERSGMGINKKAIGMTSAKNMNNSFKILSFTINILFK